MAQTKVFNPDKFFPSFEALEIDLNQRLSNASLSMYDYMTPVVIIYLTWAGFERESIPKILKKHVSPIGNAIYDPHANKTRTVPASAMKFIREYVNAPIFMSHAGISQRLVRNRTAMEITNQGITNSIANFNRVLDCEGRNYSLVSIWDSGSFCRAYHMQQTGVEFPVYRRHKRLTQLGFQKYEMIFDRKFSGVEAVTRHINLYEIYIEYFYGVKL